MIPGDAGSTSMAARAVRPLDALDPLRALDPLGALHAFDALDPLGTLRPVGAAAASAPVVGVEPRHTFRTHVPGVASLVLHDAAVVAELDAHARAGRVDAANAQPVEPGLGGELTRQISALGGG